MYTAEQIEKGLWDSYRLSTIKRLEGLDAERKKNWERWYGRVENLHKEYEELDYFQKREGEQWREITDVISGGELIIDGETVPFEFISNDDDEFMSLVKAVIKVGDQYFVKEGTHISHDGTYWNRDFYETVPKEKVVTQWERK